MPDVLVASRFTVTELVPTPRTEVTPFETPDAVVAPESEYELLKLTLVLPPAGATVNADGAKVVTV